jgi:hypothetical protein
MFGERSTSLARLDGGEGERRSCERTCCGHQRDGAQRVNNGVGFRLRRECLRMRRRGIDGCGTGLRVQLQ